jgi:hypothetical protein
MKFHRLVWTAAAAGLAFLIGALPVAATGSSKPKVKPVRTMTNGATTAHGSPAHAPKTNRGSASAHGPKARTHRHTNANRKSHGGTTNASGANSATNASGANSATNASGANSATDASRANSATNAASATANGPKAKTHRHTKADRKSHGGATNANASGNGARNAARDSDATPPNNGQRHLQQNEPLRARLESRLPPGTDVNAAAAGFRNQGQFVAAVNVSQKLGIRFVDLKALMTGDHPMSLGQAIHQLKGMDANASGNAANAALRQANGEIQATSNAASNTTNSTPTNTATGPRSNN